MATEAVVSLGAARAASSPALLGFGGDSAIELLSAAVVLRRFYLKSDEGHAEERALAALLRLLQSSRFWAASRPGQVLLE
jgi:hypothetical protein